MNQSTLMICYPQVFTCNIFSHPERKKTQKLSSSESQWSEALYIHKYINLCITQLLKRQFLRTLSFLVFLQQTHYNQCFHLTCQPVSMRQQRLKSDPSLFSRCWRILRLISGIRFSCLQCYVGIFRWGAATDCWSSFLASLDLPFMFLQLFALFFMLKAAFVLQGLTHFSPFLMGHEHHGSLLCITLLYLE